MALLLGAGAVLYLVGWIGVSFSKLIQAAVSRQREFLALLETRKTDRNGFTKRVREWLLNWERNRPPELARSLEESWKKRAEFYAAVDKMLTTEQRSHLSHRLQDYIDDFRYLAAQKTAVARND